MSEILFVISVLFTIGPIIIFHKNHEYDYDNKWSFVLPLVALLYFGYMFFINPHGSETDYFVSLIAFLLSIYSNIVTLIMYSQYHNRQKDIESPKMTQNPEHRYLCPTCHRSFSSDEPQKFCSKCGNELIEK